MQNFYGYCNSRNMTSHSAVSFLNIKKKKKKNVSIASNCQLSHFVLYKLITENIILLMFHEQDTLKITPSGHFCGCKTLSVWTYLKWGVWVQPVNRFSNLRWWLLKKKPSLYHHFHNCFHVVYMKAFSYAYLMTVLFPLSSTQPLRLEKFTQVSTWKVLLKMRPVCLCIKH